MLTIFLMYALVGAVAGLLAGLLGIGGGLVIVPMLIICFTRQGIPAEIMMHLAVATSVASIMFTAVASFMAHNKRGAVDWSIFKRISVSILIGAFLGSCVASLLPGNALKAFFGGFLYFVAYQMFGGGKPQAARQLPGSAGLSTVGGGIGAASSLVGIGGGVLSVPFLVFCNVPVRTAIGTSAAIGFPIAVAGTIGYIVNGLRSTSTLPPYHLGYIYLPALAAIVVMSVLAAPVGVKLAHTLPVDKLKKAFAILLVLVATRMIWSLF